MRSLESEVRDLKNLLDEKDEKIDVLSRIHSFSPTSQHKASIPQGSPPVEPARPAALDTTEQRIKIQPLAKQSSDSRLAGGLSSTRGFVGEFFCFGIINGRMLMLTLSRCLQ